MVALTKKFLLTVDEAQLKSLLELCQKNAVSEGELEIVEWLTYVLRNDGHLVATYKDNYDYDEIPF